MSRRRVLHRRPSSRRGRGYSFPPRINRCANDSKVKYSHITSDKGIARQRKSDISKKSHAEEGISPILYEMLFPKGICAAIAIADSLYTNWNSIRQLFEEYQRGGIQSVMRRIGTETARTAISSIQTEAIWATISGYIPKEYQNISKEILANFMNTITTAEIALAKQILQQRG